MSSAWLYELGQFSKWGGWMIFLVVLVGIAMCAVFLINKMLLWKLLPQVMCVVGVCFILWDRFRNKEE